MIGFVSRAGRRKARTRRIGVVASLLALLVGACLPLASPPVLTADQPIAVAGTDAHHGGAKPPGHQARAGNLLLFVVDPASRWQAPSDPEPDATGLVPTAHPLAKPRRRAAVRPRPAPVPDRPAFRPAYLPQGPPLVAI